LFFRRLFPISGKGSARRVKSFDQNTFSASFPAVFPAPKERFLHAKNPAGAWAFFT
jgi:hypothetical protein